MARNHRHMVSFEKEENEKIRKAAEEETLKEATFIRKATIWYLRHRPAQ